MLKGAADITCGGGVNPKHCLLHRGPERGWGYSEHLPVPRTLPLCRIRGGAGGAAVVHGTRLQYSDNVCRNHRPPPVSEDCTNVGLGTGNYNDAAMGSISVGDVGDRNQTVYELKLLTYAADKVSVHLRVQTHYLTDMPTDLIRPIQTEFNRSYWKVFTSVLPVRWPLLVNLSQTLTNGHFSMDIVAMPGALGEATRLQKDIPRAVGKPPLPDLQGCGTMRMKK